MQEVIDDDLQEEVLIELNNILSSKLLLCYRVGRVCPYAKEGKGDCAVLCFKHDNIPVEYVRCGKRTVTHVRAHVGVLI